MKVVLQRVTEGSVSIDGQVVGAIGRGLVALVGVAPVDSEADVDSLAAKIVALRIFEDDAGKMNLSIREAAGELLAISQFTLFADVRRGNRPSFTAAADPTIAEPLYRRFCEAIEGAGVSCARGVFGADMSVALVNDGPVTLILDSEELKRPRRP